MSDGRGKYTTEDGKRLFTYEECKRIVEKELDVRTKNMEDRLKKDAERLELYSKEQVKAACDRAVEGYKRHCLLSADREKNRDEQEIRCIISKAQSEAIDKLVNMGLIKSRKVFFYNAMIYYSELIQSSRGRSEYVRTDRTVMVQDRLWLRITKGFFRGIAKGSIWFLKTLIGLLASLFGAIIGSLRIEREHASGSRRNNSYGWKIR